MTTTSMVTDVQPQGAGKQKGVFKKMIRYLQDQAVENSNSRSSLSPPGLEPQQKIRYTGTRVNHEQHRDFTQARRRFSEATTVVESRQTLRGNAAMAGDGTDSAVFVQSDSPAAKEMKKVHYAQDNILQNYKLHIPKRDSASIRGDQYWIIYIHGGYFRDPKVDATSFGPALDILTARDEQRRSLATVPESASPSPEGSRRSSTSQSDIIQRHVAGYASINYRLAPHPAYPQDDNTENYIRRNAHFPQQLQDVHAAIRHLSTRFDITNNYILVGHSVGATLAFLAALKSEEGQIDPPACIVGLNGIYDFPALHEAHPDYEPLTRNAMRIDQYRTASPALYPAADYCKLLPQHSIKVLLSHSHNDGLVDWNQLERMHATLEAHSEDDPLEVEIIETVGEHDAIWKDGGELARTIVASLQMVTEN